MTRYMKALGLAVLAILAMGALTAQGASAEKAQEFHSDGSWTVGTGASTGKMKLTIGAVGSVECNATFEDQSGGVEKSANTYVSDMLTVTPRFTECTFGGQPATFNVNHCAFVLDSDTTEGNPEGGEHANVEIECAVSDKIQIHTINCTVTIVSQLVKHAIQFEPDTSTSVKGIVSAKNIVIGKERNTASQPLNGCITFPTGAVGSVTGNGTTKCYRDDGSKLSGTEKTTPNTLEGPLTECSVQ